MLGQNNSLYSLSLTVETMLDKGTTFTIAFPSKAATVDGDLSAGGAETTIIVVTRNTGFIP